MEIRKLKVVGNASKKANPDTAKVYINMVAEGKTAELANSIFTNKAKLLKNIFKQLGYDFDNLKTEHFYVDKNYAYEDNKRVDKGYKAVCSYSYVMPLDYSKLEDMIKNLSIALELRITYEAYLKQQDEIEKEVINLAFNDAKNKAEVIAKACNVTIGDIAEIVYDDGVGHSMYRLACESSNLSPSEVEIAKSIEVSWEIK